MGAGLAAAVTGGVGLLGARSCRRSWIGFFSGDSTGGVRQVSSPSRGSSGQLAGFFGVGLALYFASQGTGRVHWALLAGFARLAIAAGGGIVASWLGGDLTTIFLAVAIGFVVFGGANALAVRLGAWRGAGTRRVAVPRLDERRGLMGHGERPAER